MRIIPPTNSKAKRATWLLCLIIWCRPIIIDYLVTIVNKVLGVPYDIVYGYILPFIYIVLAIVAAPYITRRLKTSDWAFYFVFLTVYFSSYVLVSSNSEYLGSLLLVLPFEMLPLYFLGVSFEIEPLKKQLYVISIISILAQVFFYRFVSVGQVASYAELSEVDHFMHLSYQVLPFVLYTIWWAFENPKIHNILIAFLGGVLLLLLGTRGPFASIFLFSVVYLVVFKYSHLSFFQKLLIILGGCLLYSFFTIILTNVMDVISSTGGSNRIIRWLLGRDEGATVSSEARVDMAELTMYELKQSGYMGLGFAGDRIFMGGFWVHNFILECLISFGIVFGVLIPIVVFYRLIKGILRDTNSDKCKFLWLLIGLGMIPILVSGSYVEEPWFYLMLGYCTQTLRATKQKQLK